MIEWIDKQTFQLKACGSEMTLVKERDGWSMYTVNAAVRAYRGGVPSQKRFPSLIAMEAHYKSWQGFWRLLATRNDQFF